MAWDCVKKGSHSLLVIYVYLEVEWAISSFTPQPQSITAFWLVLIYCPTGIGGWVVPLLKNILHNCQGLFPRHESLSCLRLTLVNYLMNISGCMMALSNHSCHPSRLLVLVTGPAVTQNLPLLPQSWPWLLLELITLIHTVSVIAARRTSRWYCAWGQLTHFAADWT